MLFVCIRFMIFSQAFRVLHGMSPKAFRHTERLYKTIFLGEQAIDAGGPYRESFASYTQELQSSALPLLIRTPNGRNATGYNREKWILNPGATSSTQLEMFSFLGKLLGVAIRSKEYLALNIPPMIWKLLLNETPSVEDLEGIDSQIVNSFTKLRNIEQSGIDAESFSYTFFETFTTISSDDRIVELVPGGKDIDVTFDNRIDYCDKVINYRLHEFDVQAAAVRQGMSTIIPIAMLNLHIWDQLETMVCGKSEVDVALLEQITEYQGCSPSDPHVRFFWQALGEFDNEERSAVIKFVWGRSRLPLNAASFSQKFKIQTFSRSPADMYLPVSHTCFFSLELPSYTSTAIMKEKLRYAIFNCTAIDTDGNSGMDQSSMHWED